MALSKGFELGTLAGGLDVDQSTGEVITINMDTDVVTEGSTNLYYTDERVDDRVSSLLVAGTNIGLTYDDAANTLTVAVSFTGGLDLSNNDTDDLAEGSTNLYYTDTRVNTFLGSGSATTLTTTGNVTIGGNLTVNGTTTTINSTTLDVDDINITVASGSANKAAANGAGLTVDLGSDGTATITYDSTNDEWDFNKQINVAGSGEFESGKLIINEVTGADAYTEIRKTNTGSNLAIISPESVYVLLDSNNDQTNRSFNIKRDTLTPGSGSTLFHVNESGFGYNSGSFSIGTGTEVDPLTVYRATTGNIAQFRYTGGTNNPRIEIDAQSDTLMRIDTSAASTVPELAFGTGGTTHMLIDANGFVGIGTATPAYPLHIYDASGPHLRVQNSTQSADFYKSSADLIIANNGTSGNVRIWNTGSERVRVDANGNVGIGTTSPSANLDIYDAVSTDLNDFHLKVRNNTSSVTNYMGIAPAQIRYYRNTQTGVPFTFASSVVTGSDGGGDFVFSPNHDSTNHTPTERMRIKRNGNVGIGTTNPLRPLHVYTADNITARFESSTSTAKIQLADASATAWIDADANRIGLGYSSSGNGQILFVTSGGNVGVNTSSPNSQLDVYDSTRSTFRQSTSGGYNLIIIDEHTITNTSAGSFDIQMSMTASTGYVFSGRVTITSYNGGSYANSQYASVPFIAHQTGGNAVSISLGAQEIFGPNDQNVSSFTTGTGTNRVDVTVNYPAIASDKYYQIKVEILSRTQQEITVSI